MSEWQEVKLGELVDIGSSKRVFYEDYVNSGIPFYRSKEVIEKHNGNDISTELFITKEKFEQVKAKYGVPQAGDLLLTSVGTLGIPYIVEEGEEFYFKDGNLTWFKNYKSNLYNEFLYYWIISPIGKNAIDMMSIGSTQAALTIQGLKNLDFDVPPIEEQKAIASVLSSLDDKIDLLHRQNTTLERMAETLFRQWFVEEAQEDWEEVRLGDFVEINKKSINKNYPFSEIEYLDTGSLTEGKVESLQTYSIKEAPSRALRLVEHNDVLISTVRPNQKHYGIINNPIENLVVSSGFCVLTPAKISPHFVYLLLTNNEMTEFLHSIAEGSTSTYPSLKPADIAAITFQLPPKSKLEEFAKIANDSWEKIHQNYKQIQTLEELRDTLLPKLMNGEIRIG